MDLAESDPARFVEAYTTDGKALSAETLASVLAISCLAFLARTYPLRRRVVAVSAAIASVVLGNVVRIAGSIGVGLISGRSSLVLFHDWVGSIFGLAYTLFGYLIMLYILLPPESARPARRVALHPHEEIVGNVVTAPQRG